MGRRRGSNAKAVPAALSVQSGKKNKKYGYMRKNY